jgi:hypothetical protein
MLDVFIAVIAASFVLLLCSGLLAIAFMRALNRQVERVFEPFAEKTSVGDTASWRAIDDAPEAFSAPPRRLHATHARHISLVRAEKVGEMTWLMILFRT